MSGSLVQQICDPFVCENDVYGRGWYGSVSVLSASRPMRSSSVEGPPEIIRVGIMYPKSEEAAPLEGPARGLCSLRTKSPT